MSDQHCPKCSKVMHNLGNASGVLYCSYPAQWDEIRVCHSCRVKVTVRVRETREADIAWLGEYEDVTRKQLEKEEVQRGE